jgi:DNA-binding transcriptional MerR regulator
MVAEVPIPKRAVFKPAEVCTIAGVQRYILRSWEAEFPLLARAVKDGGARVYRRSDVEMVLQIKALVYGEGLTLGAAHRKLDAGNDSVSSVDVDVDEDGLLGGLFDTDTLDLIGGVKQGLRDILDLLLPDGQSVLSQVPNKTKDAVRREEGHERASLGRGQVEVVAYGQDGENCTTSKDLAGGEGDDVLEGGEAETVRVRGR